MTKGFGDRRDHLRFEITGQLWASLDVTAEVTICDISVTGGLIEAPAGRLWSALRTMTIRLRPDGLSVTGVVRHLSPARSDPKRQRVGLQFVHVSPAARAELEQLVGQWTE